MNGGVHLVTLQVVGPGGNGVFVHHSTDGGLTFPTSTLVDVDPENEKPMVAVDRTGGSGHGRIALTFTRVAPGFWPTKGRVFVTTSSDDGQTWTTPQRANDRNAKGNLQGYASDAAIGSSGEILLEWVDAETWDVMFDLSTDGGLTFGNDRTVADIRNPSNPLKGFRFDLKPVFAIAADTSGGPYSGSVYIAYHTVNKATPSTVDVLCATSRDLGLSWSSVVVHPGDPVPTDQILAEAAVDALGGVEATWLDRRASSGGNLLEQWGSRSLDGGATFVETKLADAPFDPADSYYDGVVIGHYESLEALSSYAYACWADCRAAVDDLEVWVDRWQLDLATDATTIPVSTGGAANLAITPGPNLGGATYLLLGSASGTEPGLDFGDVHLPLVWDAFTTATVVAANGANLQNTFGSLDVTGSASARIDSLGPLDPSLAGLGLDFASLFFDPTSGRIVHATSAVAIELVP